MQGVSVSKALGAGIAALAAMFALWGALFAVQPAYAADAEGLSAGSIGLDAAIAAPSNLTVKTDYTVKSQLKQTADTTGTWTAKVTKGADLIASTKIAKPTSNNTTITIKGKKAGKATIEVTFTSDDGVAKTATFDVKVVGLAKGETATLNGIVYKRMSKDTVWVKKATNAARKSMKTVKIAKTAKLAGNKKANDTFGATYKITGVAPFSLHKMKAVKTIVIGDNVKFIGKHAFCYGSKLTELVLGKSVQTIKPYIVHVKTNKIKAITINSTKLKTVKNSLKFNKSVKTIKVPASKVKAYKKLFKQSGKTVTVKAK